jgi:hypothetical protein
MHIIPYTVPITIVDPQSCKHLIGQKGVIEGHNVELIDVREHCAIVKDTDTGETWKVLWGKLVKQ